ncbi:MAG: transglutaminase domain-containing protein, partial [Gammaproteobacteria bacterium]|nr:transglutaminase domain-containing protein [Gammaproteobacteria bacterium]
PGAFSATVFLEFDRKKDLIPAPMGITELREFPAERLARNDYGTLIASGLFSTPYYYMEYTTPEFSANININTPVSPSDLYFPEDYESVFTQAGVTLQETSHRKTIDNVKQYFSSFKYSLYRLEDTFNDDPLGDFILRARSGHCEHFASATVLMLRYLGVPARYVVGYSVQEFDPALSMFVVRKRHAHAWAIAWLDNRWQVVDTTPADWELLERKEMGLFAPLMDEISRRFFLLQRWWELQKIEAYQNFLFLLAVLLFALLIFRLSQEKQVVIGDATDSMDGDPGVTSLLPFHKLEKTLTRNGLSRYKGELLSNWLSRIDKKQFTEAIRQHYKWRFHAQEMSAREKTSHANLVNAWIQEMEKRDHREDPGT